MKSPAISLKAKPVTPTASKPKSPSAAIKKVAIKSSPAATKAKPVATSAKSATKTAKPHVVKTMAAAVIKSSSAKPVVIKKTKPTTAAKPAPAKEKVKKAKLIRDSFTMPEAEYQVLDRVKKECLKAGIEIKKSQLLRIGVALISKMELASLKNALTALPPLKTGRPKKN